VLFTYLTVSRALPSRREELIEALWPWRAPAGADTALSALLSRLRSVLGSQVGNDGLHWPRRDGLKWPHFGSVVWVVDVA
jgi:DNA-binding SARP family transcriptional activator